MSIIKYSHVSVPCIYTNKPLSVGAEHCFLSELWFIALQHGHTVFKLLLPGLEHSSISHMHITCSGNIYHKYGSSQDLRIKLQELLWN